MYPGDAAVEVLSAEYGEETIVAVQYRPLAREGGIADVLDGADDGILDTRPVYTARREARIEREEHEVWMVRAPDGSGSFGQQERPVTVRDTYETEEELAERLYAGTPGTRGVDWLDALLPDDEPDDTF